MANLEELEAKIQSPAMRTVYAHWQAARGTRRMPAWRDIDPVAIGRHLPKVWAWRFDRAQDTFIGRLAGEDILTIMGRGMRGRKFADCFPPASGAKAEARQRLVIDMPSIMYSVGRVYLLTGKHGLGERIVLPLAEDGITGDGVLGVTDYHLNRAETRNGGAMIDHHDETVTHYPIT